MLKAGSQTLSVTFTPTDTTDYTTATATVTLTVNKATPTITWATPAAITYGTALSATQLDASSTVAGTFAYTPAVGNRADSGIADAVGHLYADRHHRLHHGNSNRHVDREQGNADDYLGGSGGHHLRNGAERDAA